MKYNSISILSERQFHDWPSWDLVHEWEDAFSQAYHTKPILVYNRDITFKSFRNKYVRKYVNKFIKRSAYLDKLFPPYGWIFRFDMSPMDWGRQFKTRNTIPCIIDFFLSPDDLSRFNDYYREYPVVCISSREAYDFLIANRNLCPDIQIAHLPLSIADKYQWMYDRSNKKYDVILFGRQNPVLEDFFYRYVKEHPRVSYVYREMSGDQFNYYTNDGEFLGNINNRDDYWNLMKQARICLYSTPGIDGGEARTKGFNQITPKFLEHLLCGCHVIARYAQNSDTDFYEINKFSPSIETYEQFEFSMDYALTHDIDEHMYKNYLKKHYTSVRATLLKELLKSK